jgi:antitoxin Phd
MGILVMKTWAVQDAKAHFSEMLDTCLKEGPQMVTKRGTEAAVLVSAKQWNLLKGNRPTLKEVLLGDGPRFEIPLPTRGKLKWRKPPSFD